MSSPEETFVKIEKTKERLIEAFANVLRANGAIYVPDFIVAGMIDRAISISDAFCREHEESNYVVSAILLRNQIDTAMRAYGLFLVPNYEEACDSLFKGVRFDRLEDESGKKLRDYYLKEALSEHHPWVKTVYENASGFVHFSNKNIFTTLSAVDDEAKVEIMIGTGGASVPEEVFVELAEAFAHVFEIIADYVEHLLGFRS